MRLALVLMLVASTGCLDIWGMCGPSVGGVFAEDVLPIGYSSANATKLATALQDNGYRLVNVGAGQIEFADDILSGTVGPAQATVPGNATRLFVYIELPSREFADDERGYAKAQHEADDRAAEHLPRVQALAGLLTNATGAGPAPRPVMDAGVSIC